MEAGELGILGGKVRQHLARELAPLPAGYHADLGRIEEPQERIGNARGDRGFRRSERVVEIEGDQACHVVLSGGMPLHRATAEFFQVGPGALWVA